MKRKMRFVLAVLLFFNTTTLTSQNSNTSENSAYKISVTDDSNICGAYTNTIKVNDLANQVFAEMALVGSKTQHVVKLCFEFSSSKQEKLAAVNNRIVAGSTMPVEVALKNGEIFQFATAEVKDNRIKQNRNSPNISCLFFFLNLSRAVTNLCDLTKMTDEQRNGYVCSKLKAFDIMGISVDDFSIPFSIKTAPTLSKMAEELANRTGKRNDYCCATNPPGIIFRNFPSTNTENPDDILLAPAVYPLQQFSSLTTSSFLRHLYLNCTNLKFEMEHWQKYSSWRDDKVRIYKKDGAIYSFCGLPIVSMFVEFHDEKPKSWEYYISVNTPNFTKEKVASMANAFARKAGTKVDVVEYDKFRSTHYNIAYKGMHVRMRYHGLGNTKTIRIEVIPPKNMSAPQTTRQSPTATSTTPATTASTNRNKNRHSAEPTSATLLAAAGQRDVKAMYTLGMRYHDGSLKNIPKNDCEAYRWLMKAYMVAYKADNDTEQKTIRDYIMTNLPRQQEKTVLKEDFSTLLDTKLTPMQLVLHPFATLPTAAAFDKGKNIAATLQSQRHWTFDTRDNKYFTIYCDSQDPRSLPMLYGQKPFTIDWHYFRKTPSYGYTFCFDSLEQAEQFAMRYAYDLYCEGFDFSTGSVVHDDGSFMIFAGSKCFIKSKYYNLSISIGCHSLDNGRFCTSMDYTIIQKK